MKRLTAKNWFLAALIGLVLGTLAVAGENVWVSRGGTQHHLGGGTAMFIEDGEGFDVTELRDGETRTFGEGPKRITATRDGEEVHLSRPASGKKGSLDVVCRVGRDSCKVVDLRRRPGEDRPGDREEPGVCQRRRRL